MWKTPQDFGAGGQGATNDRPFINAWLSSTDDLEFKPQSTYAIEGNIIIPEDRHIVTNGSKICVRANFTSDGSAITISDGAVIDGDLIVHVAAGYKVNRAVSVNGGTITGRIIITSDDQQANNNNKWNNLWVGEGDLIPDITYMGVATVDSATIVRNAVFTFDTAVSIPAAPSGIVFELGNSTDYGAYLGFDSGSLIFRAGAGGSGAPANAAILIVDDDLFVETTGIFYGRITPGANGTVELWYFNNATWTLHYVGMGTASGSFAEWSSNSNGGFGRWTGTAIPGGYPATNFNGTMGQSRVYNNQTYGGFDMRTPSSQMPSEPSSNHGALYVKSTSTAPVYLGQIQIDKFDYAVTIGDCCDIQMGDVEITNFVRGVRVTEFVNLIHGDVFVSGRSPNTVDGHIPGQNAMLISNGQSVLGGALALADTGEHGLRLGSDSEGTPFDVVRWTSVSVRRTGQCGIKLKGNGLNSKRIDLGTVDIEDAGYRSGVPNHNPGLNEAGLLVEGVQELLCAGGRIRTSVASDPEDQKLYSCNVGIDSRGTQILSLGTWTIANTASHALGVSTTVDEIARDLKELTAQIIAKNVSGRAISVDCETASTGLVDIDARIDVASTGVYIRVKNDLVTPTYGPVYVNSRMSAVVTPTTTLGVGASPNLSRVMIDVINLDTRTKSTVTP